MSVATKVFVFVNSTVRDREAVGAEPDKDSVCVIDWLKLAVSDADKGCVPVITFDIDAESVGLSVNPCVNVSGTTNDGVL